MMKHEIITIPVDNKAVLGIKRLFAAELHARNGGGPVVVSGPIYVKGVPHEPLPFTEAMELCDRYEAEVKEFIKMNERINRKVEEKEVSVVERRGGASRDEQRQVQPRADHVRRDNESVDRLAKKLLRRGGERRLTRRIEESIKPY